MLDKLKNYKILIPIIFLFLTNYVPAEEEEINLKAIADQIQVITKDIKTLEKAVYKKSDVILSQNTRIQEDLVNTFQVPENKIQIIPNSKKSRFKSSAYAANNEYKLYLFFVKSLLLIIFIFSIFIVPFF